MMQRPRRDMPDSEARGLLSVVPTRMLAWASAAAALIAAAFLRAWGSTAGSRGNASETAFGGTPSAATAPGTIPILQLDLHVETKLSLPSDPLPGGLNSPIALPGKEAAKTEALGLPAPLLPPEPVYRSSDGESGKPLRRKPPEPAGGTEAPASTLAQLEGIASGLDQAGKNPSMDTGPAHGLQLQGSYDGSPERAPQDDAVSAQGSQPGRPDQTLKSVVQSAFDGLLARAEDEVPESEPFPTLSVSFQNPQPSLYAGRITLSIGHFVPWESRAAPPQDKRYFEVSVKAPDDRSDSSQWLWSGSKRGLLDRLRKDGPQAVDRIVVCIQEGACSLQRDESR